MSIVPALARPTARQLRGALALAALLALWELSQLGSGANRVQLLPAPTVLYAYVADHIDVLLVSIQPTLIEALAGLAFGAAVGVLLGVVFVRWPVVEAALGSSVVALNSLPMLAILPLLVIWFGVGLVPKIIVAALFTFFPIMTGVIRGLRSADRLTLELMHVLNAHWVKVFTMVRLPTSLPHVFAGLKIAAPQAVLGATVAEWIGSRSGLGAQILIALTNYDVPMLWAAIVASVLLAGLAFGTFAVLEFLIVGRRAQPSLEDVP